MTSVLAQFSSVFKNIVTSTVGVHSVIHDYMTYRYSVVNDNYVIIITVTILEDALIVSDRSGLLLTIYLPL